MTPVSWNTDELVLEDGRRQYSISCRRWKNYRKQGSLWQKIDAAVQSDRTVSKFSYDVQFPANVQDWTGLVFNSMFSPKVKVEDQIGNNSEPDFLLDVTAETEHNVAGVVGFEDNPNWMGYPRAWDEADLIYEINHNKSCQLKKLLRINSEPSGSDEFIPYNFLMRSSHAKIFMGENREIRPWDGSPGAIAELNGADAWVSRSTASDDSEIRGSTIETPRCWYTKTNGEMVSSNVKVTFSVQSDGITVRATKHIPRSMIQAAMVEGVPLFADTTFRTDDVGAVGSDHIAAWTGNDTWTNAVNANGTESSTSYGGYQNAWWLSTSTTTNQWDRINRGFTFFDTSALTGSVTDASLTLYGHGASDGFSPYMLGHTNIFGSSSTGTTSEANSDYETAQTTAFSTAKAWFLSGSHVWTFNASGRTAIDVAGFSRFSIMNSDDDIAGSEMAWQSGRDAFWQIRLSEYTGDYGPQLDVTTVPPPPRNLRNRLVSISSLGMATDGSCSVGGPSYNVTYDTGEDASAADIGDYVYVEKRAAGAGVSSTVLSTYVYLITAIASTGLGASPPEMTLKYLYDTAGTGEDSPCDLPSGGGSSSSANKAPHKIVRILGPAFTMFT